MKFINGNKKKRRIKYSNKDFQERVVDMGEKVAALKGFNKYQLTLLKADIDARTENMKNASLITVAVGFLVTFYMELIKKTIDKNEGSSMLMFLVVIAGLLLIASTFSKLYNKNLLYQRLIEIRIKEEEEKEKSNELNNAT